MNGWQPLGLATLLALAAACAHVERLDARVRELEAVASQARARGAYRCAPEELALAEAQLEFARRELREGDAPRAREHLVLAQANAHAALHASASCGAPRSFAPKATRNVASIITARRTPRRGSTKEHASI